MTTPTGHEEPPRPGERSSDAGPEPSDVGFAAIADNRMTGMRNVEVTDPSGVSRVLMVRFPRLRIAIGTIAVTVIILGLPWLIVPFMGTESGAPVWVISLATVIVLVLVFGWVLVPSLITAIRGGYLALTPTGIRIETGLWLLQIPWTAISRVAADDGQGRATYPLLRLTLPSDFEVWGWPWPIALTPMLLGSSRRKLQIPAWWFQPVSLASMVALIRYLADHPGERPRIGTADPAEWLPSHL